MGGLTVGVVAALLVFLLVLAFFARRNPVLFKLGLRNIPRRRAQTVLIIIGLMLSTAIITSALALGDTVSSLIRNGALDALGATDIVVESPTFAGFGDEFLTVEQADAVLASVDGDSRVDGAMPQIRVDLPILNPGNKLTSVGAPLLGLDPSRMRGFDAIRTSGGKSFQVELLGARDILLNEGMADDLDASSGDELTVIAPTGEHRFTVAAVVMGVGLAGTRGDGTNSAVGLVRLETMQELLDREGLVNRIEVSLTGGARPSADLSDEVATDLQLEFTDDEVADELFATLSEPELVALINDYIAANEEDIREAVKEDLAELVAELEAGTSTSREFRSSMTDPFVAGTVILALEEAGRSELALATTFMLAELEILRISEVKVSLLEIADIVGSFFTTIFGIFGSFSIMVGLLLIFLVFVMLAASRMTEMGIARAIGTKRRQLVQSFVFEGAAYAFLASIAGVVLGILASLGAGADTVPDPPRRRRFHHSIRPSAPFGGACVCGRNGDYTHHGYGVRIPREQIEYRGGDPRPSRGVRSESKAGSQTPTAKLEPSAHSAVLSAISWDSRQAHKISLGPGRFDPTRLAGPHRCRGVQADIALHSHWVGVGDTRGHPGGRGGIHLFGSLLLDRSVAGHSRGGNGAAEFPGEDMTCGTRWSPEFRIRSLARCY